MTEDSETNRASNEKTFPQKVWIAAGITALVVILIWVFIAAFNVLLLILAAVLIAVYFRGLASWIAAKTKLSEKKSLWLVIGGTLVLIALIFWLLGAKIQQQVSQLGKQLPDSAQEFKKQISQHEWGRQLLNNRSGLQKKLTSQRTLQAVGGFFKTTFGVVGDIYVILFVAIFFIASPSLYKNSILALLSKEKKKRGEEVLNRLGLTLRDWLVGKIFAMVVVAVLTGVGLTFAGVPMALALALIAGILNFVPNFGPLIAMIPAVLVALSKGTTTALIVAGMYILIQVAESNFITPLVQKRLIQIPPAFIIIGQVTMGLLTGALGLILATPFLAILMVLIQELYIKGALQQGGHS